MEECQALVPHPFLWKTVQDGPKAQDVLPLKPLLGRAEMLYVN